MTYTRFRVIELLQGFLDGSAGPYEFDDFLSSRSSDPEIEAIRLRLAQLPDEEPSDDPTRYAGERAKVIVEEIIRDLQNSK